MCDFKLDSFAVSRCVGFFFFLLRVHTRCPCRTLSLVNHPSITNVSFKHLSSLKSASIDNCSALHTIEARSPISSFNLTGFSGLELHLDEVPNLTDLKLALLPSLTYLVINNTNLRTLDVVDIGSRGPEGLYVDLDNISADFGRLVIGSAFASSLTSLDISDTRGGITELVIGNLSRPMGYELDGMAALRTLRVHNVTLAYVDTEETLPGADLLIELARMSFEGENSLNLSPDTLHSNAVPRVTAVRLIDNPVNELAVYDLPFLRSVVVSGSPNLKDLFIGRSALTSLDISGLVASDVEFELGFGNITNKNLPNQLTSLTIDGRQNGGALSRALTEFWMDVDSTVRCARSSSCSCPKWSISGLTD